MTRHPALLSPDKIAKVRKAPPGAFVPMFAKAAERAAGDARGEAMYAEARAQEARRRAMLDSSVRLQRAAFAGADA
jgi:hypothetical protein